MGTLDDLAGQADRLAPPAGAEGDAGAGAPPTDPAPTLLERNTKGLCFLVALIREATASDLVFNPPLKTLAAKLPDDKLPGLLQPWGKVLTHYGVDLMAIEHPALEALLLTGPAIVAIVRALAIELRERRPVDLPAADLPQTASAAA